MEQYIIKGGTPLVGEVVIGGAKNAALGILAAAIMTDGQCLIDNMPNVRDTNVLLQAMEQIGATVVRKGDNEVLISGKYIDSSGELLVDNEYIRKIRASYYLIGALLGKYKKAKVVLPGGCEIGSRPIDQHIKRFRALGAEVKIEHGIIMVDAEELRGSHIYLDVVSVGATINIMMAASLAHGNTIIENAAKEPHIVDVANFLNSMGASIKGAGTDVIRIKGVEKFHDTEYSIIPDQIEAGTFMIAAAMVGGDVLISNVLTEHLKPLLAKLNEAGVKVVKDIDSVRVISDGKIRSTDIKTLPYPGFPTDLQAQFMALMTIGDGLSRVTETVFENRFMHVGELQRMGASIQVEGRTASIRGVPFLRGAFVRATDLRAGAALTLAGLAAHGQTEIGELHHIDRGYDRLVEKLQGLGADIVRVTED